ncbi:MAG: ATP-binding protein [Marvinbryantia sp.]|jgi:hypothetical protein
MLPDNNVLLDNLGKIAYTLDKAYISRLNSDYRVCNFDEGYNRGGAITYKSNIRGVRVKRWVFNKDEKPGDCFKNVLSAFADGDHTLAMVITRHVENVEMFFVIKNEGEGRNEQSADNLDLLESALKGNFPGSRIEKMRFDTEDDEGNELIPDCFSFRNYESVAALSNTPSEYSEDYLTQGIDKLLEGIVPENRDEEYSVIFLAESMSQESLRDILSGYEELATAIAPFAGYQFQIGEGSTGTTGEMSSIANTESVSDSIFKTHSINIGINGNMNRSNSNGKSVATSGLASGICGIIGGALLGPVGSRLGQAFGSLTPTLLKSLQKGLGLGIGGGYGYSWGNSHSDSNGKTDTKGTSSSISLNVSQNTSYTYKSYMVQNLLQKLEETMKRIIKSQSTGLWKFSSYVMSTNSATSINVANYLKGLTQGKASYIEPSIVQEWSDKGGEETSEFKEIRKYLSHFCHPVFLTLSENNDNGMFVTPTSYISTDDLGYVISFPEKSIPGIPVLEGVRFGREPHSLLDNKEDLEIGIGYHMHQKIPSVKIKISKEELTKHTFITGSTGSGKSNTIYKLLDSLGKQGIHYLVVEPAKGEYKDVLGKKKDVVVYGTNPLIENMELLRINPFRFPKSIHVLEHMDRIVEIFNVCWPMYAAMPAILKDSIERAYVDCGWDLETSENMYSADLFPSFADVTKQIKLVLEESDYSDDNKGDYTGSLVTRLNSLSNGINGLILSNDDLTDEELFDRNVIVDLSRVGSSETKSLLMGLLVLKLQEHRMDQRSADHNLNSNLKHITVLEEAHNLLRRTSTEQNNEGSNLIGKSVEMLSNSIAEMRTYGEGFIIADQSPGLLDMSVIRNTNTKIIMRLPDYSDRLLVGKSAGLSDNQINELSHFERGVAVISQSDWLEPVLCMVDKYEVKRNAKEKINSTKYDVRRKRSEVKKSLLKCIMSKEIYRKGDRVDILKLRDAVIRSNLDTAVKCDYLRYIASDNEKSVQKLRELVFDFFDAEKAIDKSRNYTDIKEWTHAVVETLNPSVKGYSNQQVNLLLGLLINEKAICDIEYQNLFERFTEIYKNEGRVY